MRPRFVWCILALPLASCFPDETTQPGVDTSGDQIALAVTPPAASVTVTVTVPAGMNSAPFDVTRQLTVPPSFTVAVYTRIPGARFMAMALKGHLLVSQPSTGKVLLVRPNASGNPLVSNFVTGLRRPHDMAFRTIGGVTYLYIAETHQINRYVYQAGDLTGKQRQIVVSGLPDASSPVLGGRYGHELKNIALDGASRLYVSIASTCNACLSDTQSDPVRGSVYRYNADGTGGQLFARGLRNAEGLAFIPGTNQLWAVVNNRDNIPYPFNDGSGNYGRVIQSFVDNHPPEEFTRVRSGRNYGWPFCNPNPDTPSGMVNMPFDQDYDFNASGTVNCGTMEKINRGIQAHSAPLGLLFFQGTNVPTAYRNGAVVGLHGSWNRAQKTGYKVIYFPWDNTTQLPAAPIDLVKGWLVGNSYWGRPVDIAVSPGGNIFISDDHSGTVYKLMYAGTP